MADPMGPQTGQTGVQVRTKFFPFAFLLYFFKPRLCLDGGEPVVVAWGETFIPAPPGRHAVRCFVKYLYLPHMGDSTIDVDVPPGGVASCQWRAPLLIFLAGKWTQPKAPQGT